MEDDYDEELPPISVSTSLDESVFAMPSAEVLASQRAREEQCERELLQLKARHELHEAASRAVVNGGAVMPLRSDSSGSEGETMLASAVEALRVSGAPERSARAAAAELLDAALARLPPAGLCRAYRAALDRAGAPEIDALADDIISSIGSWVCGLTAEGAAAAEPGSAPSDDEVLDVGAWLCCGVLWRAPALQRARTVRALHALLGAAAAPQLRRLARLAAAAWAAPERRLQLAAAAAAGGARAQLLAAALCRAALTDLLADDPPGTDAEINMTPLTTHEIAELAARGWRGVAAAERGAALRLLGRALAAAKHSAASAPSEHSEQAALARALAALAQPLSHTQADRHRPEFLKVAVAASKLQILLSDRK